MRRDIRWFQVVAIFILVSGIILTVWSAQQTDRSMRNDLLTKTSIAKSGVFSENLNSLNGSLADVSSKSYQFLKTQLKKLRAADPDIRFTYLLSEKSDGSIIINADSEPQESINYSPPGETYTEAPAVIRSVFTSGNIEENGPYTDRWGTWISGFVPITDPLSGRVIAVFGMDVNAADWNLKIFRASLTSVIVTLLLVLLLLISEFFQRRSDKEQRKLELSEEKFSKAFNSNPSLLIISTLDEGIILDINESFLANLDYSRSEVVGRTVTDLNLYSDPGQRDKIIRLIRENGHVRNMDVRLYSKNLDLLYGSLSSVIIEIASTQSLFTVIVDLTERKRVEDKLLLTNTILTAQMEATIDGILVVDNSGKIISSNQRFIEIWGVTPEVISSGSDDRAIQSVLDKLMDPDEFLARIRSLYAHREEKSREEIKLKDTRTIERYSSPISGSDGRNYGRIWNFRDISERKKAEEDLRSLSERLALATRAGGVGIWDFDVVNNRLTWDEQMLALYGIREDEFGGAYEAWRAGVHPDDRSPGDAEIQMALCGEKEYNTEFRVLWPDGSIHNIRAFAIVQKDDFGQPIRMIGTNWDITEIKSAEDALRKSEEKILLLLNSAAEGIYGLDTDGNCTFCNNSCLRLLGYKHPDELLGKNMHWLIHGKYPDGTYFPVEECRIFRAFHRGKGSHVDDEVLWRADGSSFPAEYWSYPQHSDNVILGAVVTFLDITERKNFENQMKFKEQELLQFSEALATANKKLKLLSSITRHDINNQLMVLMGFLSILKKKQQDDKSEIYFRKIETAAERISTMVRFTREYENIGVDAPIWQECRSLVDKVSNVAPLGSVIVKNDLTPGAEIYSDPLIEKVFYNLIENAVRYGGKITSICFFLEDCEGEKILICKDDGNGIPSEEKNHIFERGFGKNTGMGLFLSREILSITGITIIESGEPGKGARFEMTVPKDAYRFKEL